MLKLSHWKNKLILKNHLHTQNAYIKLMCYLEIIFIYVLSQMYLNHYAKLEEIKCCFFQNLKIEMGFSS